MINTLLAEYSIKSGQYNLQCKLPMFSIRS